MDGTKEIDVAGHALRVIPRQTLNFSYLDASSSETRVVAGKIPTAPWTEGSLLVRVHGKAFGQGSLVVSVILDASTDEDPSHSSSEAARSRR